MSDLAQPAPRFREIARGKLGDARIQTALDESTNRLRTHREDAWAGLPGVEELRQRAHEIRMEVIDDLDGHVARFTAALAARGGHVYFAHTAAEASAYVAEVCRRRGAKLAAKSKSMEKTSRSCARAISSRKSPSKKKERGCGLQTTGFSRRPF